MHSYSCSYGLDSFLIIAQLLCDPPPRQAGLPLWGISAGYIEKGAPTLGAIALPELGLLLSAASACAVGAARAACCV